MKQQRLARQHWMCGYILAGLVTLFMAPLASANTFVLGAFGSYGIVVDGGTHNAQFTSNSPVFGNVALGQVGSGTSSVALQGGGDTFHGNLDFGATSNGTGSVTVTGTTNTNSTAANQAVTDALNLFNTYSGLTGTHIASGTTSISASSGTLSNGARVFQMDTAWTNNSGLTISGSTSDLVVINVGVSGDTGNPGFVGAITLAGGITTDQVLFNVLSTGSLQTTTHSTTFNGLIVDPNGHVNLDNFTMNGRLYAGVFSSDFQWVSGAVLNAPADVTGTPEPAGIYLLASGLGLLLLSKARSARG